ncbi:MAG: hypothetical protein A2887_05100 [Alphaproteobacteria bacterium RIFCSPLOWO2_01_FULL_40_26]|nr:MAG: hypothetical protein A3D15_03620 [Alphaproteobacteria bacterium RIFCSPHIGHO2_02_FULL_40_34]OFW88368.1 MAG: hypothetical protein A2794_02455 [Alphaproteobacteria bacterium RIFCSPHIGHO2_01_FULL_40_8]OFW94312.1 MAG: hypothetical protein A2887_05100 [Alphaproteobacteria bacterium RIFCSPLOWO2_01_FULL_40_26]OFX09997.1 MAG: hypothetical protein A3H30_02890 [Alphaproteobacteria bacterium RIFCSPLOWO2_02_FULL_40_19]OFX11076.1 MAG: hypothetical protein A3G22_05795 [Alphaproteobacteria bacterium RI
MSFKKTLIIGLGLIGGSFAKALRRASKKIFAVDSDFDAVELAKAEGVIENGFDDLTHFEDELHEFDLIVIATPLFAYEEIFSALQNVKSLVIDLGSVKDFKYKNLPQNFIPCHPIAGSENSGFEHSCADLFSGQKFVICKENKIVENLAKKIGAIPQFLDAKKHDEIFALISHLPQFLSFLTKEFSPKNIKDKFFQTAFRLDNSNPEIWEDIFEMNQKNLEKFYLKFFENLEKNIDRPRNKCGVTKSRHKQYHPALVACHPALVACHPALVACHPALVAGSIEENFAAISFRVLVVKSYLEIPEIETFSNYAGKGFKDFTSIIAIENNLNPELIEKNQQKIQKFFKIIS